MILCAKHVPARQSAPPVHLKLFQSEPLAVNVLPDSCKLRKAVFPMVLELPALMDTLRRPLDACYVHHLAETAVMARITTVWRAGQMRIYKSLDNACVKLYS